MDFKLSILICSLPVRIMSYSNLVNELRRQIMTHNLESQVEIISITDCKTISVGKKRNMLLKLSSGRYVCFIDDDDRVSQDYVPRLIEACKSEADVVTFRGDYIENNTVAKPFMISTLHGNNDSKDILYRLPNHLCPVKREIAMKAMFTDKNYHEDSDYADGINRFIKNEFHIPKKLYFYDFRVSETQTLPQNKNTAYRVY